MVSRGVAIQNFFNLSSIYRKQNQPFKGSWKREKWGVGKESNVTIWCQTVAIAVYLQFEHAVLD
jgi:hypothetical protein